MKVEQLMTRTVRACGIEDSLETAARIMWDADCGFVPVLDEDGRVVGVVTDRDICMAALHERRPLSAIPVSHSMAKEVFSCSPHDPIAEAERLMKLKQVHRLPVTDVGGKLLGILSLNDIVLEAGRERGRGAKKEIKAEEVASTLAAISQHRSSGAVTTK